MQYFWEKRKAHCGILVAGRPYFAFVLLKFCASFACEYAGASHASRRMGRADTPWVPNLDFEGWLRLSHCLYPSKQRPAHTHSSLTRLPATQRVFFVRSRPFPAPQDTSSFLRRLRLAIVPTPRVAVSPLTQYPLNRAFLKPKAPTALAHAPDACTASHTIVAPSCFAVCDLQNGDSAPQDPRDTRSTSRIPVSEYALCMLLSAHDIERPINGSVCEMPSSLAPCN